MQCTFSRVPHSVRTGLGPKTKAGNAAVRPEGKERQYITSLSSIRLLCSIGFLKKTLPSFRGGISSAAGKGGK